MDFDEWMDRTRPWWREWMKKDELGFEGESAAVARLMREAWEAALEHGRK